MRMIRSVATFVLALAVAQPAAAAWYRTSSKHFVIYADQDPERLREFATKLEKFDKAVRNVRGMKDYDFGDGNRVQVFVVANDKAVGRLANDNSGYIRGFYIPRASGSVAFVPKRSGSGDKYDLNADTVFFHEYAHHLMMQELESPLPEWLVEGFAEFMSTAEFKKDGSVGLGIAPQHRAYALVGVRNELPLETMLAGNYSKLSVLQHDQLYGRGWLLVHYLTFEPTRRGQLVRYVEGIASGTDPLASARAAFGDLRQLDRELTIYLNRRRINYLKIDPRAVTSGPIDIVPLSAGAAAVLPLRMESKRGVDSKTAEGLAARVRQLGARYPNDAMVELTLAEAELDAGHPEAAEAAATRAMAADPRSTEAMIYKGRAIAERGAKADNGGEPLFAEARRLFIAANKLDPEDPEPLMEFHNSFWRQGLAPTANAIAALHYASNLAPQDAGLRMNSAMQYLHDGKLAEARKTLVPIAFDPHGRKLAEVARSVIARIDAGDRKGAEAAAEGGAREGGD